LKKLFADGGYQGPIFERAQREAMPNLTTEIVKRSDKAKGFEVLPKHWVVERTPELAEGRMAGQMQKARQGLCEPDAKRPRVPETWLHQAHARKAM
jgi:transposase